MEKLKKTLMILSLVFIALGFAASIWLYTVAPDTLSIVFMAVFFVGLLWYTYNVYTVFRDGANKE